ncbi:hypothetical protein Q5752_006643 [Cryptotrichosporon argae]
MSSEEKPVQRARHTRPVTIDEAALPPSSGTAVTPPRSPGSARGVTPTLSKLPGEETEAGDMDREKQAPSNVAA